MPSLKDIHLAAMNQLKQKFPLKLAPLIHPFPERPIRTLGLIKIDGDVFSSEKLSRAVFLRVEFPFYFSVRTIFVRPRVEYDLPFFTCDAVFTGGRRLLVMDIHRTEKGERRGDSALIDRLVEIRSKYPALLERVAPKVGGIQTFFSRAVCRVKTTEELDNDILNIFHEYLDLFCDMVGKAEPLSGDVLDTARQTFEGYLTTWADHDPGVIVNKILFGKKGGITRGLDIFFDR